MLDMKIKRVGTITKDSKTIKKWLSKGYKKRRVSNGWLLYKETEDL